MAVATAIEIRERLLAYYWYAILGGGLILAGMLLAVSIPLLAILLLLFGWILTLPYHAKLSLYLAVVTFNSALVLPFLGRPRVWEMASLLAWSGIPLLLILRQQAEDTKKLIRENKWVFSGLCLYCLVILGLMFYRGVGFGALGSSIGGGRFYLQQLFCSIFPLLFVIHKVESKTLIGLYKLQLLLATTYIVTEFSLNLASTRLSPLLAFFDVSTDMLAFKAQALTFGIERYQSLALAGPALIYFLLLHYNIKEFIGRHAWWLIPVTVGLIVVTLLGGHRSQILFLIGTTLIIAWAQRFYNWQNIIVGIMGAIVGILFVYIYAEKLPLAAQRTISFLPGIKVSLQAQIDADMTIALRREVAMLGIAAIPDYLLIGRGFTKYLDPAGPTHPVEMAFEQGVFYNGLISLLVNTGLPGTIGMLLFMFGGGSLAIRTLKYARRYGCNDILTRAGVLVAADLLVNIFFFIFLHGNAEWAVKYFALQIGFLMGLQRLLTETNPSSGTLVTY